MEELETATPVTNTQAFECPTCGKPFGSKVALSMHEMRVHTRAGQMGPMWKKFSKLSANQQQKAREQKKEYQRKIRERNIAKGLTARGTPRKRPVRANYVAPVDDSREAKRLYNRNWYKKQKAAKHNIRIVYPPPAPVTTTDEIEITVPAKAVIERAFQMGREYEKLINEIEKKVK